MVQKHRRAFDVTLPGKAMERRDAEPAGQVGIHPALKEQLGERSRFGCHRDALDNARTMLQDEANDRLVAAAGGGREGVRILGERRVCRQYRCRGIEVAVSDEHLSDRAIPVAATC